MDNGPEIIPEKKAKQGSKGRHVLIILITSLALAAVAAAIFALMGA